MNTVNSYDRIKLMLAATVVTAVVPALSEAAVVSFSSDTDFVNNAQFTKAFGANARWGNGATNGDWEYAVVNSTDNPFGTPSQLEWSGLSGYNTTPNHGYEFTYDGSSAVRLTLDDQSGTLGTHSGTVSPTPPPINAIAARARAADGDVATMHDIRINFTGSGYSGQYVDLGTLVGDVDAQYIMLIDDRLAGGFSIDGAATLRDGNGSLPMYQYKVGTVVPIPAAAWLFGSALLGLLGMTRKTVG